MNVIALESVDDWEILPQVKVPVAQWVKRWSTELGVPSLTLHGEVFSAVNRAPFHTAFIIIYPSS